MARTKDRGWIKLHRQIVDSSIWKQKEPFDDRSAWIDLLLMTNHEDRTMPIANKQFVVIHAGQLHTSMQHLADRWHWSRDRVIRYFRRLSAQGMCTTKSTPYGTTVSIVKWGFFQVGRTTDTTTDNTTDDTTGTTTDATQTRTIIQELYNKNGEKNTRDRVSLLSDDDEVIE